MNKPHEDVWWVTSDAEEIELRSSCGSVARFEGRFARDCARQTAHLAAHAPRLIAMLLQLEWVRDDFRRDGPRHCPACGAPQGNDKEHLVECELVSLLASAGVRS